MRVGLQVYKHADGGTFTLYHAALVPDELPPGFRPFTVAVFARTARAAEAIATYVARTGPFGEYSLRRGRG